MGIRRRAEGNISILAKVAIIVIVVHSKHRLLSSSSMTTTKTTTTSRKHKDMYSDFVGVTYNKIHAKYQACITHYRKQHYLGR